MLNNGIMIFFIKAEPLAARREEALYSCVMATAAAECGGRTEPWHGAGPRFAGQGGGRTGQRRRCRGWRGGRAALAAAVLRGSLRWLHAEPRALHRLRARSALCALQLLLRHCQPRRAQVASGSPLCFVALCNARNTQRGLEKVALREAAGQ